MTRERDRIIEYIARRICARLNHCDISSAIVDGCWQCHVESADEALRAIIDYDAARAA
jgi:hypothetical protein